MATFGHAFARMPVKAAAIAVATAFATAACGGAAHVPSSTAVTSSATGRATPSATVYGCQDVAAVVTQYTSLTAQLASSFGPTPGQVVPTVGTFQQLIRNADRDAGTLDGHVAGVISDPLHTLREALDQFYGQASLAQSLYEINSDAAPLSTASSQAAIAQVRDYLQSECGVSPAATP